jgi:hypothetical protein
VVQDVCAAVGVTVPTSVFANIAGNRTMQEMLALANEMAQRITADTRDWTMLKVLGQFNGDGVTTAFTLPANFLRMPVTSSVYLSGLKPALRFYPNTNDWAARRASNEVDGYGEWTIIGGQMHIFPVMPVGRSAWFVYITRNSIALASGGFADRFVSDGDSFALGERLLKLGMTFQWKAHKGSPYAEDMGTYADALMNAMGHDSPAPILVGKPTTSGIWHADF